MKSEFSILKKMLDDAIRKFGEYTFFDKGSFEVMDVHEVKKHLRGLSGKQIANILVDIRRLRPKYGENFARDVMSAIDDWDGIDDLYEDERLKGLY